MTELLQGVPSQVADALVARYEPLRDSRAYCEPEKNQRNLLEATGYTLMLASLLLEGLLLVTQRLSTERVVFGFAVAALGGLFVYLSKRPLKFTPPESFENLAPLSQGIGLCRKMAELFPETEIELDPLTSALSGSSDGRDWEVKVVREALKPVNRDGKEHDTYTIMAEAKAPKRIWSRSSHAVNRHRIVWTVAIEGDFTPRAGKPSEHTSLDNRDVDKGRTFCTFSLPINQPDQPGLGHEARTDYISSPMGLHHPEFVGEQIALSLAWLFSPQLRRL